MSDTDLVELLGGAVDWRFCHHFGCPRLFRDPDCDGRACVHAKAAQDHIHFHAILPGSETSAWVGMLPKTRRRPPEAARSIQGEGDRIMADATRVNVKLSLNVTTADGQPFCDGTLNYYNMGTDRLLALEAAMMTAGLQLNAADAKQ